jgi:hypothetical protein
MQIKLGLGWEIIDLAVNLPTANMLKIASRARASPVNLYKNATQPALKYSWEIIDLAVNLPTANMLKIASRARVKPVHLHKTLLTSLKIFVGDH